MEILSFEQPDQWEAWLAEHHGSPDGAWLKVRKKNARQPAICVTEAADVALCFGWIDSIRKSLDADHFLQRYSRRRPKGSWSRVNVERMEALMAQGRVRAPGLAEVEAAKADGRWDAAYVKQSEATVPPDLAAALAADQAAGAFYTQLGKTDQYLVMLPLLKATTPGTRATRLNKAIADLAAGKRPRP
ncbi:YdeI/OmpD-associated family protein [Catellatospora sichuanensis]|uniref:YdeI/OmpD-associated family protein n=1 Tax=Catellatospora sichuanensis TaxID=1969805 RepID=UPI001182601B|nr:YdeI/OmpD-associated family protein [Catellatospora sichuanensis]